MKEIKVIEDSLFSAFENEELSELNEIRGGGFCIKYEYINTPSCSPLHHCGVKMGCVPKN